MSTSDITAVFYTANHTSGHFAQNVQRNLLDVLGDIPLISVSKVPMEFGENICVGNTPRSHLNIYRQALVGAKAAKTPYIALCEDDVLYSPAHFKYRPTPGKFAYDIGNWGIYTWNPEVFSWKGRRALLGLICERKLFIGAMEERFNKYPDDDKVNLAIWAEPGKYERQLGVTVRETEEFYSNPANIVFSHYEALAYDNLGKRKRLGELRATEVPYWGKVKDIARLYDTVHG